MKRREFLHNLAHAAAYPTLFSTLGFDTLDFSNESALSNTIQDGNILILIRLDGGNDGLNTIIPMNQMSHLSNARPHIILPENKIIDLGQHDLGLHPKLTDFKPLFDEGRFKIIQNVGYPNPDFSHFRSMDIIQTASSSDEYFNEGWMGRYVENRHPEYPSSYPNENYPHPLAIELGSRSSNLFTGSSSLTSYKVNHPTNLNEIINDFDNVYPDDIRGIKLKYIQLIAKQSNDYGAVIKEAYVASNNKFSFPNTDFGRQMENISRLILGGLKTRIYLVQLGGFDTHDNQVDVNDSTKGEHASLLEELNDAIIALIKNLDTAGKSDKVLSMTFSEFGRTITSNSAKGTDHGSASPMMIFGNNLNPDILGDNPIIPPNAVRQDQLDYEFDYRQVYSSIINQWLGGTDTTSKEVLYRDFEQLPIIKDVFIDTDGDGVPNTDDICENTPEGAIVDLSGCELFSLPYTNYSIATKSASCIGAKNGSIEVTIADTNYNYQLSIPQLQATKSINGATTNKMELKMLDVGIYTINITVEGYPNYLQTFEVQIGEPLPISAFTKLNTSDKSVKIELSGAKEYIVEINGQTNYINTQNYTASLRTGNNTIKVSTSQDCQGVYQEEVFISEEVRLFPNPTENELNVVVPGSDTSALVAVYNTSGQQVYQGEHIIPYSRTFRVDLSGLKRDLYTVNVNGLTVRTSQKIIKK